MCIRDRDRPKLADPMSMVITEVSIVDVSAGASAHSMYPGKFKAFTEDKTLSYFKDMGEMCIRDSPRIR